MGGTGLVGALLSLLLGVAVPVATHATSPAYGGDFPDPSVLVANGTYWAYSTQSGGRNIQVMSSPDLTHWSPVSEALPVLPAWATTGFTWAPGVTVAAGRYVMYYAVRDTALGRQCLSVATSTTPGGPFIDTSSGPFICQPDHGGSIDASPFTDADGTRYLVWKSEDNALGQPSHLWGQELTPDGLHLVGGAVLLMTSNAAWQGSVTEGPDLVRSGGALYLFYGANNWTTAKASIGYATCWSPLGPCANASRTGPWMATHGAAIGPSGPSVFTGTDGKLRMAYHAWVPTAGYATGGARSLWIDTLHF